MEMLWDEIDGTPFARTLVEREHGWHLPQPLILALRSLVDADDVLHGVCSVQQRQVGKPQTTWEGLWWTKDGGLVHVTGTKAATGWRQHADIPQPADQVGTVLRRLSSIRSIVVADVVLQDARQEKAWAWAPTATVTFDDGEQVNLPRVTREEIWEGGVPASEALLAALRRAWMSA